ncbi:CO/xanthine dehydrogenase FAD-binding subunit [Asanoa ferruginea]|uniref:CO/xanthine dehydrogenase FAD-binding subunit n=1 Tax=Asanoa ferruginea TaxID=53367 RepID=A0A3D9ZYU9_9ACTN|nr:FAD binding domain-containing protein [Asanoa ferruginea]REF98990.1 CO/xanthine dehydrogenase FAD-binding subunit [Asanoa ferruginea]GIF46327.1 oxidoreductase [Asanoa ferruginea]
MLTEVHVPDDVSTAVGLIAGGATAMGGGTSLMPWLNDYASPPTELVSLRRTGLSGVHIEGSTVTIGAATTLAQLEQDQDLNPVVRSIASVPVRNLATVGGNLFARQPHGDLAVALVALDARVTLLDDAGTRDLPVEDFVSHDRPSVLVTSVAFERPAPGTFRYLKAARRRFNSISVVTVAAAITEAGGLVTGSRVALGGVGPWVIRAHAVEAALTGRPLTEATVSAAAQAGLGEIAPADDAYASAWYRTRVFPVHLRRALLGH